MKEKAVALYADLYPTAWQNVAETQDTPMRSPYGKVFACCDQVVPLKEATAPSVPLAPTAWQNVAEAQDTPLS